MKRSFSQHGINLLVWLEFCNRFLDSRYVWTLPNRDAELKPRDIIIERWIQYGAQAKRKTVVQRAAAAQQYAKPSNVIIQYEAPQVRIVRQFQRLGVTQTNPVVYVQQYGATLLDAVSLVQQARAAGVVEDISPPAVAGSFAASSSEFASSTGTLGYETAGVLGGATGLEAGGFGLGGASSYESSSYAAGTDLSGLGASYGGAGLVGTGVGGAGLVGTGLGGAGLVGTGLGGASSYESSYSSSTGAALGGTGNTTFAAAGY